MASLFAALTTAVSGLNAQSSAIGNISDNLANAETVGYKSVGTAFEELVNASSLTVNNPGGVKATPEYQNGVQGSIIGSNVNTSLAISGQGYFAVETASTDATGATVFNGQSFYTRQGDFTLNNQGYFVNSSGYFLTGYSIDNTGAVNTSSTVPIQVSALQNDPVAATTVNYSANLPSNAANGFTAPASTLQVFDGFGNAQDASYTWTKVSANTWNLDVSIPSATDQNGNPYNAIIPYTFNDGSVSGTTAGTIESIGSYSPPNAAFTVDTASPTGSFTIGDYSFPLTSLHISSGTTAAVAVTNSNTNTTTTVTVTNLVSVTTAADMAGNLAKAISQIAAVPGFGAGLSALTAAASGSPATTVTLTFGSGETPPPVTPDAGGSGNEITWNTNSWDGTLTPDGITTLSEPSRFVPPSTQTSGKDASVTIDPIFGNTPLPLTLSFGTFNGSTGVTQFADTSSSVTVSNFSQNGLPKGSFNSISIDSSGFVSLNYSNGTNKKINQIAIAQFFAQDGLQRVTGGAFTTTLTSGNALLGVPGSNGAGTIASSSLEASNVDIATEFTQLIESQQVYTANSKLVTTDNQLLQVTLNMIQ